MDDPEKVQWLDFRKKDASDYQGHAALIDIQNNVLRFSCTGGCSSYKISPLNFKQKITHDITLISLLMKLFMAESN